MLNSAMVVMASQTVIQCVLFKNCSKLEKKPSHYSKDFYHITTDDHSLYLLDNIPYSKKFASLLSNKQ